MFSVKMKLSIIILTIFVTALCFTRREMSQNVTLVTLVIPGHAGHIRQRKCLDPKCLEKPAVKGPGRERWQRWTFNHHFSQRCEIFWYRGGGGSGNNFGTKEECERKCGR